jgi:hypothetical protein
MAGKHLNVTDTIVIRVGVTIAVGIFITVAAPISTIGALAGTIRAQFVIDDEPDNKQLKTDSIKV